MNIVNYSESWEYEDKCDLCHKDEWEKCWNKPCKECCKEHCKKWMKKCCEKCCKKMCKECCRPHKPCETAETVDDTDVTE